MWDYKTISSLFLYSSLINRIERLLKLFTLLGDNILKWAASLTAVRQFSGWTRQWAGTLSSKVSVLFECVLRVIWAVSWLFLCWIFLVISSPRSQGDNKVVPRLASCLRPKAPTWLLTQFNSYRRPEELPPPGGIEHFCKWWLLWCSILAEFDV